MDSTSAKTLGIVDYVLFGFVLLISSVIGIYFGFRHRKKMTSSEYLLANKSISWVPIFVSLVVSFFSSVGVMGLTANMYSTGVTFAVHAFAFIIPITLNAEVFTPIFRRLQLVSVNEVNYCLFYHKNLPWAGVFTRFSMNRLAI